MNVNWDLSKEQRQEAEQMLKDGKSQIEVYGKLRTSPPGGWLNIKHIDWHVKEIKSREK